MFERGEFIMGIYCSNKSCDWWDLGEGILHEDGTVTHRCPKCNTLMNVEEDKRINKQKK